MLGILYNCKRTARVNHSTTAFAKMILLFFGVLFTAVLIHPDVDLLDVHDVKITSVRSQIRPLDRSPVRQVTFLLESLNIAPPQGLICLCFALDAALLSDQRSAGVPT